jgi:hypothetical protein
MSSDTVEIRSALGVMRAETSGDAHALLKRSPLSSPLYDPRAPETPPYFGLGAGFSSRRGKPWGPKLADRADAAAENSGASNEQHRCFVGVGRGPRAYWKGYPKELFSTSRERYRARPREPDNFTSKRRSASTIINALAAANIATIHCANARPQPKGSKRRERE